MELVMMWKILAIIVGYGLGSIPFGVICGFLFNLGDIRTIGSGNIGATNVLRTGNKKAAFLTLLLDGVKGVCAVMLMKYSLDQWGSDLSSSVKNILLLITGASSFIGHLYPVWLKFKGGKGVATFIGLQFALNGWGIGALSCLFWLLGWKISGISSIGGIGSAVLTLITLVFLTLYQEYPPLFLGVHSILGMMLIMRHHENIRRLFTGTEPLSQLQKSK
jgi:acyl phosphate:glycerol-3-phosphate acyltransferase